MTKNSLFLKVTRYTRHTVPEFLHTLTQPHPDLRSKFLRQKMGHTMDPIMVVHGMPYGAVHGKNVPNGRDSRTVYGCVERHMVHSMVSTLTGGKSWRTPCGKYSIGSTHEQNAFVVNAMVTLHGTSHRGGLGGVLYHMIHTLLNIPGITAHRVFHGMCSW